MGGGQQSQAAGGKIVYSMLIEVDSQPLNENRRGQLCRYVLCHGQADRT